MAKRPRLQAAARVTNSSAVDWRGEVAVSTGNFLNRCARCTERSLQLIDRGEAAQPRRARKNIDVDHAGFRPRVEHRVRLRKNQDAGQTGAGEGVRHRMHYCRSSALQRTYEGATDQLWSKCSDCSAAGEIDGIEDWSVCRLISVHGSRRNICKTVQFVRSSHCNRYNTVRIRFR